MEATETARLTVLAERLNCLTEDDLLLLAGITSTTAETWRKRGEGPGFVRAGRRVLYPAAAVAAWLASRTRERREVDARGML